MNKKILLLTCFCMAWLFGNGEPITRQQALKNAVAFQEEMQVHKRLVAVSDEKKLAPRKGKTTQDTDAYYVFNRENDEGFIIVSGDDKTIPVLGYSDKGSFDYQQIPENMKNWLLKYEKQITAIQKNPRLALSMANVKKHPSIPTLMSTQWDQSAPYNNKCPIYFDMGRAITGCVATAMAQIMYYHRDKSTDKTLEEIPAYDTRSSHATYGKLHVEGIPKGSKIDWDNMLDYYEGYEPLVNQNAVANLMLYCGVSLKMDYNPSGSGAYSAYIPEALTTYFGYKTTAKYVLESEYSLEQWDEMIYNELANRRPVYLAGGGHAFVCDGYDGFHYYHINWGWGGRYDGHFLLTNLSPGDGRNFNEGGDAVIGMEPDNYMNKNILFNDIAVEDLCVKNWDENKDGKLSYAEAANVKDIATVFKGKLFNKFSELRYFTGITKIPDDAFNGCEDLYDIALPEQIEAIGNRAFKDCFLFSLLIPSSVKSIGKEAFQNCRYLGDITIPSSITTIHPNTFDNCTGFLTINIPESVTSIGSQAFRNCENVTTVTVNTNNPANISMGNGVFEGMNFANATLIVPKDGKTLFSQANQWKEFGTINEYRKLPKEEFAPVADGHRYYIYNVGTGKYLGEDINYRLYVSNTPVEFTIYKDEEFGPDNYYMHSEDVNSYGGRVCRSIWIDSEGNSSDECSLTPVDTPSTIWHFESIGNNQYTIQIPQELEGYSRFKYFGVGFNEEDQQGIATDKVNSNVPYVTNPDNCHWAFIEVGEAHDIYFAAQQLENLLSIAKARNIDREKEQAIFDNMSSNLDELQKAQKSLRKKLDFIHFADELLRKMAPKRWDTNKDGEVSISEAKNRPYLGNQFFGSTITSFDELKYFTGISSIYSSFFSQCQYLASIQLPSTISTLEDAVFSHCVSLKEIELPEHITEIGSFCFAECSSLRTFSIANPDPSTITLGEEIFWNVNIQDATLYVPIGSKELYANAPVWKEFGKIEEMRTKKAPPFSPLQTDEWVYIYQIGSKKFLTKGEAYGTQAVVGATKMRYQLKRDNTMGKDLYYLYSDQTGYDNQILFRTVSDQYVGLGIRTCFVDGTLSPDAYWHVESVGDNLYTFQVPSTNNYYIADQYMGVNPNHPTGYGYEGYQTSAIFWDVPYQNNESSCQWAFIKVSDYEAIEKDFSRYDELKELLKKAHEKDIDVAEEQAVYDNIYSADEEIINAIVSVRKKMKYITFNDDAIKVKCTKKWDEDGDEEISFDEVAGIEDIGDYFHNTNMMSFDELQYFTSLQSIPENAFSNCTYITSIYIPANIKKIGKNAFSSCTKLKYVAVLNPNPQEIDANGCGLLSSATVFVPKEAVEAYQNDSYWKRFTIKEYTGMPVVQCVDDSRMYGRKNANLKYSVEGAPINGVPNVECNADEFSPVGTYPIEVTPGTITTFGVKYIPAIMTVTPYSVTATALSYTRYYGEPNPVFKATYRTFRNKEEASDVLTKEPTFECDATPSSPVGEYEIRISGAEAQNYIFKYVNGTLTVIDNPNAIKGVTADEEGSATIYDLQGRKVQDSKDSTPTTLQKGIYIINGKKVVRK